MTRNLPRSYNTICFIVFYGGLWTQAGLLARIIQLYAASTLEPLTDLSTQRLFSHTPELLTGLSSAAILHWVVVESYPGFNTGFYTGWRSRDE